VKQNKKSPKNFRLSAVKAVKDSEEREAKDMEEEKGSVERVKEREKEVLKAGSEGDMGRGRGNGNKFGEEWNITVEEFEKRTA
jgi:hypothetical protein